MPLALSGLPVTSYAAGAAAAAALGGGLADRLGRRGTIALSMTGSAAAMLLLSTGSNLAALVALAALAGLFANMYRPASAALVADVIAGTDRVTAYAAYDLVVNLGNAIGLEVAGLLADRSFTLLFVGDALTSLAFAGIALTLRPAVPGAGSTHGSPRRVEGVIRDRPFCCSWSPRSRCPRSTPRRSWACRCNCTHAATPTPSTAAFSPPTAWRWPASNCRCPS